MFIESLDPRRLMAAAHIATGLDPAFGNNGRVRFDSGFTPTHLINGNAATFVGGYRGATPGTGPTVVKITSDGTIDIRFGINGYASVPHEVTELAFDTRGGYLYVGARGDRKDGRGDGLNVTRLKADGRVDKAYGANGTFGYSPVLADGGDQVFASASVEHITVLPNGSAVLAVDRQTQGGGNGVSNQSLVLIKLRPGGTLDPRYGTGGVTQLISGTFSALTAPSGGDLLRTVRRGFFSDVQTDSRGLTRALIRFGTGRVYQSPYASVFSEEAEQGRFDIKARTVTPTGTDDPEAAYTWKLADSGNDLKTNYHVRYAGRDGPAVRALLTEEKEGVSGTAYLYTLRRGERPTRQALDLVGVNPIFSLRRSADGTYLATDSQRVTRLRRDFTRDRSFGVRGVATPDIYLRELIADDRGGVLAIDGGGQLDRFK